MANEENMNEMDEGRQVVAFKLRDEEYGVSILNVQEIRNLTDITRVPFSADFIKGVINLRGSVLPVIDLKKRLGLAETPYTDDTRIVTVNIDDLHVGMLVDAVTEVLTIDSKPVDTKKAINDKSGSRFLSGIGNVDGRLIIMLNLEEIIGNVGDGK
ncbi:chemotaxis protein CheW [Selenomonas caprae]|jgi:purine-binding chemotaxis protein CheW|uniref:Chemotaxis protein CheW n=3 Tax=Selenomonas TaxID=970 RepID=A0A5D6W950_9FIRM|nr:MULTISPECIES: chemotaxis protein CheW [Selenomonas]MDD6133844.1 chemotaxis protein CheW [Selenomonadaceae bacterium]MBE6073349.1 chemotaxis protein CheW [Selenomonas ruminantium]MBQ1867374.1 chemotaxis protein CheW [Selenomonas sp.]MBQ1890587.1 chemotaxis protein CheW [Selenomonas sp.]MCR5439963.1 chemotaxis protein CheW [Selenomonas sp.]